MGYAHGGGGETEGGDGRGAGRAEARGIGAASPGTGNVVEGDNDAARGSGEDGGAVLDAGWDWYQGRLALDPCDLAAALDAHGMGVTRQVVERAGHGYQWRRDVVATATGEAVAVIRYGEAQAAHLWATGRNAQQVADACRAVGALATVARCDAQVTVRGGAPVWESWHAALLGSGVRPLLAAGCWDNPADGGRTLYVGDGGSSVRVRLYEKGRERGAQVAGWPTDAVRAEVQVRPGAIGAGAAQRQAMARAAVAWKPGDAWQATRRGRQVTQVLSLPVGGAQTVRAAVLPNSDALRAVAVMWGQYGRVLRAVEAAMPGLLSRQLGAVLAGDAPPIR